MIRKATLSDLDALIDIETRAFSADRLSRRSLRFMIVNPRAVMMVFVSGHQVMAYGLILHRKSARAARLYSLAVHPDYQGRGVSRALLCCLEQQTDRTAISLEVRADNQAAISLYESMGYSKLDMRKAYYVDGMNAVVMRKRLKL